MIYIDTEEWLEGRSYGIGGSEAGIVLGVNPFKSRLELWNEKVTKTRHLDPNAEMHLKLGNMLEPFIAEEYSRMTGRKLEMRGQKTHPKYSFMLGNIDREITGANPGILEIKTKGAWTNWEEDIPIYYMAQMQHYLELYSYNWGSFAILDLGRLKIKYFDVERDEELINRIIKEEIAFWDLVKRGTPPIMEGSKSCEEFLREHYAISLGETIDLRGNKEIENWIEKFIYVKNEYKVLEKIEIETKTNIMSVMGQAEKAIGNQFTVTWKSPKDKEVFDLDKFKTDYPDLVKKYTRKERQTRRFSIKILK